MFRGVEVSLSVFDMWLFVLWSRVRCSAVGTPSALLVCALCSVAACAVWPAACAVRSLLMLGQTVSVGAQSRARSRPNDEDLCFTGVCISTVGRTSTFLRSWKSSVRLGAMIARLSRIRGRCGSLSERYSARIELECQCGWSESAHGLSVVVLPLASRSTATTRNESKLDSLR